MKKQLLAILLISSFSTKAQKIEGIYINLYTDSLKKGTYNYINVDGQLSNGKYIPLDSTYLIFSASSCTFSGNSIIVPKDFRDEKITIKVTLKQNKNIFKEFDMWIKKVDNTGKLKTTEEVLDNIKKEQSAKKGKKKRSI